MARKRMYIYKITCLNTKKSYIGRTVKQPYKRLLEHFSDSKYIYNNTPLHSDMKKYPKENFIIETLCEFYCENYNEADLIEQEFIKKYNLYDKNIGYNIRRVKYGSKKNV